MSKAFTKEDDSGAGDEAGGDAVDEGPALPQGTKNYISPGGARRLRDEVKRLLEVERPEVVRAVGWAASNGDRSENADYIYGKRRLREIDRRIRFLTKRLDLAEIVDPAAQRGDKVLFGATVTVSDEEGQRRTYRIVGIDETDAARGHVSWISPIGRSLLQARVGDAVQFRSPKGEEELEIMEVKFEPIPGPADGGAR